MGTSARVLPFRPIDLMGEQPFAIGTVHIDPAAREVAGNGRTERLQPQTMRVLVALARRRGQLVSRDELAAFCWDGRILGDDVVNRCISLLRRVAGEVGGFSIETIPKSGYRLVEGGTAKAKRKPSWVLAALIGTLLVLLSAIIYLTWQKPRAQPEAPSVAVVSMAAVPGDAAGRALSVDVRNAIADALSLSGFPVRSAEIDPSGRKVDYRISGEITSHDGVVKAAIRMEETRLGVQVFSRLFESDSDDSKQLPDRIAASLASSLTWTGALMALDRRYPSDPAVTAELMKILTRDFADSDPLPAYETARRVALKAPDSPIAQVALAMETGFALDQLPMDERRPAVLAARRASARARQLAPQFGDAYVTWCGLHATTRIAECENHMRAGLAADPMGSSVPVFLSTLLSSTGRIDESVPLARKSFALDPFNPAKLGSSIRAFEVAGMPREADNIFRHADRYWPQHRIIAAQRMLGMSAAGSFDRLEQFASQPQTKNIPFDRDAVRRLLAARGRGDGTTVKAVCAQPKLRWLTTHVCLAALANLGELDAAFAIADKFYPALVRATAVEEEALWLEEPGGFPLSFLTAPAAAPLRRDPRFVPLARRVSLLRYWQTPRPPDFCRTERPPICSLIKAN